MKINNLCYTLIVVTLGFLFEFSGHKFKVDDSMAGLSE